MDSDVRDDTALHLANETNREVDPVAPPTMKITIPGKRRGGPQAFGLLNHALSEATDAPIHLLPPELLIDVFKYYTGVDTPVQNLISLMLVCKLWRNIVEGTPRLWCFISAKEGLARVRKALAMAKDAPLEIKYDRDAMADPATFFTEIIGREAQWKSVIVTAENLNLAIFVFQITTAPNLATLQLKASWDQKYKNGTVTLFGGNPASTALKDIRGDFIPVAIGPLRLSGLRSLELKEMPIISAEEVLRILRGSPALENCYLYGLVCLQDFALPGQGKSRNF